MDNTQHAAHIFNKLANLYESKFMDVSLYADSLEVFCGNMPLENVKVLEMACGPGNITQFLLSKRPDLDILGTDLAPNMVDLAKKNNPTARFEVMDVRDISTIKEKYNGIICGFGLPYLSKKDAILFIQNAAKCLKTNGLLYISTMEGDYNSSKSEKGSTGDEIFMHYHELDYLNTAMTESGLNMILTERKQYAKAEKIVTDLILIAQKLTDSLIR
jgi:2-polyprenyl-3-methyl-5-hydroxy-6-metoxy-1,4-benzoquinol methylase